MRRRETRTAGGGVSRYGKYNDLIAALAYAYHRDGRRAQPFIRRLEQSRDEAHLSPALLARVYALLGRPDAALSALEEAEGANDRDLW
jgi:hypothetical protein